MTERRPRLLMLLDRMDSLLGGGERTAIRLATDLPAHGFDVWMVTTRAAAGWPIDALAEAGVRHVSAHRSSRADLHGLLPLLRTLRHEEIDILHAHLFGSNVWGTLAARMAGTPVMIAHEHSWPFEGRPLRRLADGIVGRTADAFVAVSEADAALMHSYEKVPLDKIHVIPTAWERRGDDPEVDVRAELGIPVGAPIVGTIAVLRRVKRLELLIEAFAQVLREVPDAWLVIVGEGDDRAAIEAAVQRFAVGHRTRMTGLRHDVSAIWRAIDVGAMSSDREGTPLAVLEALAHGVPMVAPAVGGIPEILQGGGGVLVQRHDVPALAREITRLARDPRLRQEVGDAGRRRAADYTVDRQVERCLELYRTLLESPKPQRRATRRRAPRTTA